MSTKKKNDPSWSEASQELEQILQDIESGATDLDALHARVERAAELIQFCRAKLTGTETKVRKVVDALAEAGGAGAASDGDDHGDAEDGGRED